MVPEVTSQLVCEQLRNVGFHVDPAALRMDPRLERVAVHLPEMRVAWFCDFGRRAVPAGARAYRSATAAHTL